MALFAEYQSRPLRTLVTLFVAWKAFLFTVALSTPNKNGYDTSTSLLFERLYGSSSPIASALTTRLTRWDAIYYVHAAKDGYVYEQEWAFGTGVVLSIRYLTQFIRSLGVEAYGIEPLAGIAISNISHLGSVLALYKLTEVLTKDVKLSFISSALSIISHGGLFLSSPYGESPCSLLCFLAVLLFALRCEPGRSTLARCALVIASGALLGLATTIRSNGLSYGLVFAVEAVQTGLAFLQQPTAAGFLHVGATVVGGSLVGSGILIPQLSAWSLYCYPDALRPWCNNTLPSIYTFVQDYYWDVGFLRYWTLNQLPLFILAAPTLLLLSLSGWDLFWAGAIPTRRASNQSHKTLIMTLAAIQMTMAVLALTTYHVQIIARVASGYPVWYWWIAASLSVDKTRAKGHKCVMFMVMYAGIQGALYSSFLPPA